MGLALYREQPLENMNIKVGLSKELLELVDFGVKFSRLGSFGKLHASKEVAPFIKSWLAKVTGP